MHDGPGIRTTVFLKGCPLRCPWCHSPESQRFDPQLCWQSRKCIGVEACGLCLPVCPREALAQASAADGEALAGPASGGTDVGLDVISIDWQRCDDCGLCTQVCPSGALSLWGRRYAVTEVVDRVVRDRPFFARSGGGVTISGGEPLAQPGFTLALLRAFQDAGVHTALDTTAHAPWEVVERVLPHVDLFLLDVKSMDPVAHQAAIGVPNAPILETVRKIAAAGGTMHIRVPIIPRFNDSAENFRAVGEFVHGLGEAVTLVQLLPYHALGVPKWQRIRHQGPILEAGPPSEDQVAELKAILEESGIRVQVH